MIIQAPATHAVASLIVHSRSSSPSFGPSLLPSLFLRSIMGSSICQSFLVIAACLVLLGSSASSQTNITLESTTTTSVGIWNTTLPGAVTNSPMVIEPELRTLKPQAREDDTKVSRPIDVDISPALSDELGSSRPVLDGNAADDIPPPPRQEEHISCRRFCRRFCRDSDDSLACRERCQPTCRLARL